ncbi:MAG: SusC/RagA family TonB-linked outer membrane protein, partial [Mucilaginibacter sp.]|uniref:SusC/RagA family TonB-linked outer membrane protein n=1 Tax=Mucilaginibacter sp. TaxID=1882438 RepID=UPI0031A24F70
EIAIPTNQRNADFKLRSEVNNLDEVVVVGYGEQKRIHLTGAVGSIDTKKIEDIPVSNLSQALRGQIPNLSINTSSNRPGINNTSLKVRNPISYAKNPDTNPLYIIDDMERTQQDFNALDQSEVESISIIKDGAAAIYGIKGTNGAVIVRTKRGKAGAVKISYNGNYGLTTVTQLPSMMNGYQQAVYLNDLIIAEQTNGGHTIDEHGYIDGSTTKKELKYYTPDELAYFQQPGSSTDYLAQQFQNAVVQRHTLNVTGGNDRATYYAGATYVKQGSNFKGAYGDRWTYRASVDAKLANGLTGSISLSGFISKDYKYYFKQGGENADNDLKILLNTPQFTKFYIDGLPTLLSSNTSNTNALENFNYIHVVNSTNNYTLSQPTSLNINPKLTYDVPFLKGLRLTGSYNRNINNTYGKQVGSNYVAYQFAGTGENNHIPGGNLIQGITQKNGDIVRLNPVFYNTQQFTGTVSYSRTFGKHEITVLGLYDQFESYDSGSESRVEGLVPGGYDNENFAIGAMTATESLHNFGRQGYAGRINYNYASKYLLEFLMRADGSVKFAPGRRWGYFPSMSAGWVVSEEGFFKRNVHFIDYLKFRGSLAFLGADNADPYQYAENYNFGQQQKAAVFGGNDPRGLSIFQNIALANPYVRWDNDTKVNLGLDMQFLKNRLAVSVDAYKDYRRNILGSLSSSTPFVVGATPPTENFANVNTYGYEISATWKDNINKDFSYYVGANLGWFDDKLLKVDQSAGDVGTYLDKIGQHSDRGFLGFRYTDFLRTQADVDAFMAQHPGYTIYGIAPKPGMLVYEDVRGPKGTDGQFTAADGKIDDSDKQFLTKRQDNHFNGGINLGFTYKDFTVQAITTISWGGQGIIESDALKKGTAISNRPDFWAPGGYWTPANTGAELPSPFYMGGGSAGYNDLASDFWFKSSFQFRMTNLNVAYTIPKQWVNKMGLGSIRVYANMINPVNFYNPYSYRDNGTASYLNYPTIKSYTFGLNVGF